MTKYDLEDFKIVGFDGGVLGYAGRGIPIIKHKSENLYFRFWTSVEEQLFSDSLDEEDIKLYEAEGRLTLIDRHIQAFPDALVMYVADKLLDVISYDPRIIFNNNDLHVIKFNDNYLLICTTEHFSEQLMNEWGLLFINKVTDLLVEYLKQADPCSKNYDKLDMIEEYIKMGLYAAKDSMIRSRLYFRYAVNLTLSSIPERLETLFTLIISNEYPNWDWKSFEKRIKIFEDILCIKARLADFYENLPVSPIRLTPLKATEQEQQRVASLINKLNHSAQFVASGDEMEMLISAGGDQLLSSTVSRLLPNNGESRFYVSSMELDPQIMSNLLSNLSNKGLQQAA